MRKLSVLISVFIVAVIFAVLAVSVSKNNKISSSGSTAANDSSVSAQTVTEEIRNETTVIAASFGNVVGNTVVSGSADTSDSFSSNNNSDSSVTVFNTVSSSVTGSSAAAGSTAAASSSGYEYSYAGFNPTFVTVPTSEKDLELFLVNRDYVISSDYTPKLEYAVTGDTNSKKLDYRVAPHYNEMYQAAKKDGIILTTVSGYRSYSLQKSNFERKIQKYIGEGYDNKTAAQMASKIILPPGTSEHNVGLAMDIISLEENFEDTEAFEWLQENAADYGFILRYPKDKQDVTKIIYEPWHWRYVGVANAKAIKASGKCLEEYLGKVQ